LQKGDRIEFKVMEEKEIEGETIAHYKTIGVGKVIKVEDKNFSLVDVKIKAKDILTTYNAGTKILCERIIK